MTHFCRAEVEWLFSQFLQASGSWLSQAWLFHRAVVRAEHARAPNVKEYTELQQLSKGADSCSGSLVAKERVAFPVGSILPATAIHILGLEL